MPRALDLRVKLEELARGVLAMFVPLYLLDARPSTVFIRGAALNQH